VDEDNEKVSRSERTIASWSAAGLVVCTLSFGLFFVVRAENPDRFPIVSVLNVSTAVLMAWCLYMLVTSIRRM
jgi:hypothetical protein